MRLVSSVIHRGKQGWCPKSLQPYQPGLLLFLIAHDAAGREPSLIRAVLSRHASESCPLLSRLHACRSVVWSVPHKTPRRTVDPHTGILFSDCVSSSGIDSEDRVLRVSPLVTGNDHVIGVLPDPVFDTLRRYI